MTRAPDREGKRPLSPSVAAAFGAAAASGAASCVAFLLWIALPSGPIGSVIIAIPLIVAPFIAAGAAWVASQGALRVLLAPMIESVERIASQDLATPIVPNAFETAPLAAALDQCRVALSQSQRGAKVHGAVARLLGAAIGRLADGDLKARITVDLPEPYREFQHDFNRAMDELERSLADIGDLSPRISAHSLEIQKAAEQLARRAGKLAERIESDMQLMDAETADNPHEALRIASHTLGGAKVAARRNQDAATHFANLAQRLVSEAERLARGDSAQPVTVDETAQAVPVTVGATVLKLRD